MKKVIVILSLIILGLLACVAYLLRDNLETDTYEFKVSNAVAERYLEYQLYRGELRDEVVTEGVVTGADCEGIWEYEYEKDPTVYVTRGEDVSIGEKLVCIDGTDYFAKTDAKILAIATDEEKVLQIRYLDYAKLSVQTTVGAELLSLLTYDTEVTVSYLNETYEATIEEIGYYITDGTVPITVNCQTGLLPGSQVTISFLREIYEDQIYTYNEFIKEDNTGTYLLLITGTEEGLPLTKKEYVTVLFQGQTFSSIRISEELFGERFCIESD